MEEMYDISLCLNMKMILCLIAQSLKLLIWLRPSTELRINGLTMIDINF